MAVYNNQNQAYKALSQLASEANDMNIGQVIATCATVEYLARAQHPIGSRRSPAECVQDAFTALEQLTAKGKGMKLCKYKCICVAIESIAAIQMGADIPDASSPESAKVHAPFLEQMNVHDGYANTPAASMPSSHPKGYGTAMNAVGVVPTARDVTYGGRPSRCGTHKRRWPCIDITQPLQGDTNKQDDVNKASAQPQPQSQSQNTMPSQDPNPSAPKWTESPSIKALSKHVKKNRAEKLAEQRVEQESSEPEKITSTMFPKPHPPLSASFHENPTADKEEPVKQTPGDSATPKPEQDTNKPKQPIFRLRPTPFHDVSLWIKNNLGEDYQSSYRDGSAELRRQAYFDQRDAEYYADLDNASQDALDAGGDQEGGSEEARTLSQGTLDGMRGVFPWERMERSSR